MVMADDSAHTALERVLAAVGQCLDRQSAASVLRLRADTEMQGRIEELADNAQKSQANCSRTGGYRCEYCCLPQDAEPFFACHVEHIVAR